MRRSLNLKKYFFYILILFSILMIIFSLSFGTKFINIFNLFCMNDIEFNIFKLRLYRTILAFSVGSALSISGAGYQAVLKNPLVEPYILGVSSGAGIGVILVTIFNLSSYSFFAFSIGAFICSIFTVFIVLFISLFDYKYNIFNYYGVVMSGIIINTIFSSILILIISIVNTDKLNSITWWLLGSLEFYDIEIIIFILLSTIVIMFILCFYSKKINIMYLGEEFAYNLGISSIKISFIVLVITSFITSLVVSVSGIIGFVGFVVPHIVKKIINNDDHRIIFPMCFYIGGIFLIFCDILSRVILPSYVIPIGAVTAIIGGPIFIFILNNKFLNK